MGGLQEQDSLEDIEVFQQREISPRLEIDLSDGLAGKPCPERPGLKPSSPSYMDKLITVVALEDTKDLASD